MLNTTYLNAVKTTRNGSRGMVTATRAECQVTRYDYTKLDSAESVESSDTLRRCTSIMVISGQEIARNFQLFYSNREVTIKATKSNTIFKDQSKQV